MTHVAKVIEIIGSSQNGWKEAAQVAIDEPKKTLHGIHGVEITDMTAKVDPNTGKDHRIPRWSKNIVCCRALKERTIKEADRQITDEQTILD
jgi:flavin-binding protein dodecin